MTAFKTAYGSFGSVYMGFMAVLFGLTTTAGWYTYYVTVIRHLLRSNPAVRDTVITIFKILFPCMNIFIVGYITIGGYDANLFWSLVSCVLGSTCIYKPYCSCGIKKEILAAFQRLQSSLYGCRNC